MKQRQLTADEAIEDLKSRRPIVDPNAGFRRQLRQFEKEKNWKSKCIFLQFLLYYFKVDVDDVVVDEELVVAVVGDDVDLFDKTNGGIGCFQYLRKNH